ncbi:SixA phosphatase family protein [Pontibacter oryzae]|uniref:Histidine phosphatase family protein n=1 Tax=Pontibacter oryzae TaxID=2304593 RepID=A0A399SM05_9BACT|nr:phosphoglycerate mutase family protein [Pontibacter oryzae]RIJ42815.1 histidine phosphatase family protein [Pontibacter oryzae]
MKKLLLQNVWLLLLTLATVACRQSPQSLDSRVEGQNFANNKALPTTVYLVRHAEKDISDPGNEDPGLTPEGQTRAEALRNLLQGQQIGALYATKYTRTKNTVQPLAEARKLEVQLYEAHDFAGIKDTILKENAGQTVVVSGHSNTILPIIEALGAKRPVPDITDMEYDYIFKVTITPDGSASVATDHYGTASR